MMTIPNMLRPYVTVRAFITRSMLLNGEEIEHLASTRSTREMWDALKNTLIGTYLGEDVPSDEAAFRTQMIMLLHRLFSSFARALNTEKREYFSLFLLEVELNILKSLIQQWVKGKQVEDTGSIPRSPLFTTETLDKIASAAHPVSFQEALPLPSWMVEGLTGLLTETAKMEPRLRMIRLYRHLDSRYYSHLWTEAKRFGGQEASIRRVFGVRMDLMNLERVIRGVVRGIPREEVEENLIDLSFGLSREELSQATEAKTLESSKSALENSPYADLLEKAVSAFSETGKLEAMSMVFREFEVDNLNRFLVTEPLPLSPASDFSMAMLVALLRLEMMQTEILERIFRARIYKLSKEETLNLVAFFNA